MTPLRPSESAPPSPAPDPPREASAWREITGLWRPLFGGFDQHGISVEWHDFHLEQDIDWARSFHPGSLEICLNFSGQGRLQEGSVTRALPPGHLAIYTTRENLPQAVRETGSIHRFLTLEISPAFLRSRCAGALEKLKPALRRFVVEEGACPPYLEILPLSTTLLATRQAMVDPPISAAAHEAWYQAKVLEVLAWTVFHEEPGELFCARQKRVNRDRIERVCYLLERDLENPPSLALLAEDTEVSQFYLSRMFAEEMGMGIPKFLRLRRMEKAAELLRSRRMNVTEAAFAVGYSSLSAFNRAFVEYAGCCPGLYPQVKIAGRQGGA